MARRFTDNPIPDEYRQGYESKYVALHLEWESIFDFATDEQAASLVRAIIKYVKYKTEPELKGASEALFKMMRETIDRDIEKGMKRSYDNEVRWQRREQRQSRKNSDDPDDEMGGIQRGNTNPNNNINNNNNQNINNNKNNNPTKTETHNAQTRVGASGSVGSEGGSFSGNVQQPSSKEEYDSFCESIGYDKIEANFLWRDMEFHGWEIQQKNGTWREVKNWKKFVKYRAEQYAKENPQKNDPEDEYAHYE